VKRSYRLHLAGAIGTVAIALSFPATPMAAVLTYAAQEILERWGTIYTEQSYQRMGSMWVLTHQYLYAGRFNASVEIMYTHARVGSE
jgi:hypothetical protein